MLSAFSILAFAVAALASPVDPVLGVTASATSSAVGPNPTGVYINSIAYGGTGCPQGSVGSFISADRTTFTLIFDSFVASIGPGVPITAERLNCQINLDLEYPSGFQYSILNTEFRGYAGLEAGVTGVQAATYYFSGSTAQAMTSTTFTGPTDGDYEITDAIPFTSTIWSPCGAALPLNIDSQFGLAAPAQRQQVNLQPTPSMGRFNSLLVFSGRRVSIELSGLMADLSITALIF